jgi:hypothetical protein
LWDFVGFCRILWDLVGFGGIWWGRSHDWQQFMKKTENIGSECEGPSHNLWGKIWVMDILAADGFGSGQKPGPVFWMEQLTLSIRNRNPVSCGSGRLAG